MEIEKTWTEMIDNMFEKGEELDIRVMSLINLLSYRAEQEILPDVISDIQNSAKRNISGPGKYKILGKLVAFMLYTATHTVLSHFDNQEKADEFNSKLFLWFLNKFDETKETLLDFERDNPATGEAQPIWSLGSQISKLLGLQDPFLATSMGSFTPKLTEIETESTKCCLDAPLGELKEKIKSCEPNKLLYQNGENETIMPLYAKIILGIIGLISLIAFFNGNFFTAIIGITIIGVAIYFFRSKK